MLGIINKEFKIIAILVPFVGAIVALMYSTVIDHPMGNTWFYILHSTITTAVIWFGCYAIVVYLWRKYPWEHSPLKHLLIEIVSILAYVLVFGLTMHTIYKILPNTPHDFQQRDGFNLDFFITILITFLITTIHEAVFFYNQWKYNFSKSVRLEKDNIEAKYETLKSQINPHFLFNSLNSLTSIVDKNSEAVDYIQNLSEFLRYMLNSRNSELALVSNEVEVLNKYVSLQKSRFRNSLVVKINIDKKFYNYSLPPLVLQMLVENCIKHNIISKNKPLNIEIKAVNKSIIIENNLQKRTDVTSTKQGLRNITDRFKFFTGSEVKIIETSAIFRVDIPLLTVEL